MPSITIGFVPRDRFCRAAESLQRIFEFTPEQFELVVVDVGMPRVFQREVDAVLRGRRGVERISTGEYVTTNRARNLVAGRSTAAFACLIENDVMVEAGWLTALVAACEAHPADVAVPLLVEPAGEGDKVHFDERLGRIEREAGPSAPKVRILPRDAPLEDERGGKRHAVHFVEMHCILFRREALSRIGPFDETQRGSRAEVDLSLALWSAGVPVVIEPRSRVTFCPPPPVHPEEREFYRAFWNVEAAQRDHATIEARWNLVECPSAIGFAKGRLRLLEEPDPVTQLRRHEEELARQRAAAGDIARVVPPGDMVIVVDEAQWVASDLVGGRRCLPFLERNGEYWGAPADDETAVREFERLRTLGARFIVFGWPAFWWLDHYAGLSQHLRSRFPCVLDNERLIVFDLRARADE